MSIRPWSFVDDAVAAYDRAIELTSNPAELRFLAQQRAAVAAQNGPPNRAIDNQ